MRQRKIIVVGGGAAGLMAAGQAALAGADVMVLEKMKRPGCKISISGKGRCNLTNTAELNDFIGHFGKGGRFLRQAFARFFSRDLMTFFVEQGLPLVTERGGRVFPASGKASDVLAIFFQWLEQNKVKIRTAAKVEELLIAGGRIEGVICNGKDIVCDAVIVTTGGASYPVTGSTGDGYRFARSAGHSIVPVRPALVPLETKGGNVSDLTGLNLRNINVRMYVNSRKKAEAFGELVFADFGLTGPVILSLSGDAVDALRKGDTVELSIDLKPALDEKKLDARLIRDMTSRCKEDMRSVLRGLLPKEMISACLERTGIDPNMIAGELRAADRRRLKHWLKDFRLEVSGYRPFSEAIITAGGVDTREVDPRSMESKKIKGLFLAGELLDIQADTGGYNLQAAFSTGWLAGRCAASGE